jgi:hypothetical protein
MKKGSSRWVFFIFNLAIKIPSLYSWKNFLLGLLANMQEVEFSKCAGGSSGQLIDGTTLGWKAKAGGETLSVKIGAGGSDCNRGEDTYVNDGSGNRIFTLLGGISPGLLSGGAHSAQGTCNGPASTLPFYSNPGQAGSMGSNSSSLTTTGYNINGTYYTGSWMGVYYITPTSGGNSIEVQPVYDQSESVIGCNVFSGQGDGGYTTYYLTTIPVFDTSKSGGGVGGKGLGGTPGGLGMAYSSSYGIKNPNKRAGSAPSTSYGAGGGGAASSNANNGGAVLGGYGAGGRLTFKLI